MSGSSNRILRVALLMAGGVFGLGAATNLSAEAPQSEWVHAGPDGKLVYKTTPAGDTIMDFSSAGYMGGGVALPEVPVKVTLQPSGGDDSAAIQAALDSLTTAPLQGLFRGAVLLAPGTFTCSRTLSISANGIVLRGSGSEGEGATTIKMTGARHGGVAIGGGRGGQGVRRRPANEEDGIADQPDAPASRPFKGAQTTIADAYVPAGATSLTVADAKEFAVGDTISIKRPTTAAWVKLMGMDTLSRNGGKQTWIGQNRSGTQERTITAIDGNKLTIDIPLADSYDAKYLNPPGTEISKVRPASRVAQVGVEHLHFQCPPLETSYGNAPYSGVRVGGDDCWVRDCYFEETMNTTVLGGKRITMEGIKVKHTYPNLGASKPTDFSIEGSQILIDRCEITGDNMYFVWTGSLEPGPNVLLNCTFRGRGSRIQPHMRWSTGVLVDNCTVPDGGIDYANRGVAGSGHGWTMGWAVAWNSVAKFYVIQTPPGSANWAIGCIGDRVKTARYFDTTPILPEGTFESHGTPVAPQSLYLAQLAERKGEGALKNIGYAANTESMFANKNVPLLPEAKGDSDPAMGADLAFHRPINAGGARGATREFAGEKAVDGDDNTYWTATAGGRGGAALEADTEGPLEINALEIGEMKGMEHVQSYKVLGQVDSAMMVLSQGTTIGERKVDHFPKQTVWKVRLEIEKADGPVAIRKFGLYMDKSAVSEGVKSASMATGERHP